MISIQEMEKHARNMRKLCLEMGYHAGNHAAHMGGALSCIEAFDVLYFGITNIIDVGIDSPNRDRVILSKGHSSLALYSALIEAGIMPEELKNTFEDDNSMLLGHPVINRELGIEFTNGSLGMGLSLGQGVALACKKKAIDNDIYVVMGDGECNEGSCWEAFMSASQFKLDNLTALIDCNGFQLSGATNETMSIAGMKERLTAFGWDAYECDGNDIEALYSILTMGKSKGKPRAVIMNTVKGKGFSFSEGTNSWHHAVVTNKLYEQGLEELGVAE